MDRTLKLLNVVYKILTKVLANRLNPELAEKVQATFIKVRFVQARVPIVQEIICGYSKQRLKCGVLLKLQFARAYDILEYGPLLEVPRARGFW